MGRLSKKEIEARKQVKKKKVLGYLVEALIGGVIFTLLAYIILGDDTTVEIVEYIQSNNLAIKLMFVTFPIATIILFAVNLIKGTLNGDLDN